MSTRLRILISRTSPTFAAVILIVLAASAQAATLRQASAAPGPLPGVARHREDRASAHVYFTGAVDTSGVELLQFPVINGIVQQTPSATYGGMGSPIAARGSELYATVGPDNPVYNIGEWTTNSARLRPNGRVFCTWGGDRSLERVRGISARTMFARSSAE
jgi:hypothetical protein